MIFLLLLVAADYINAENITRVSKQGKKSYRGVGIGGSVFRGYSTVLGIYINTGNYDIWNQNNVNAFHHFLS